MDNPQDLIARLRKRAETGGVMAMVSRPDIEQAADALEALMAENAVLKGGKFSDRDYGALKSRLALALDDIAALQAAKAGNQDALDAARYRFLVEQSKEGWETFFVSFKDEQGDLNPVLDLRTAIDAAMQKGSQ